MQLACEAEILNGYRQCKLNTASQTGTCWLSRPFEKAATLLSGICDAASNVGGDEKMTCALFETWLSQVWPALALLLHSCTTIMRAAEAGSNILLNQRAELINLGARHLGHLHRNSTTPAFRNPGQSMQSMT